MQTADGSLSFTHYQCSSDQLQIDTYHILHRSLTPENPTAQLAILLDNIISHHLEGCTTTSRSAALQRPRLGWQVTPLAFGERCLIGGVQLKS